MEPINRETAKILLAHFRNHRKGIRNRPEMASICLICGSSHIIAKAEDNQLLA